MSIHRLPLTILCLIGLSWPLPPNAYPFGVLNAKAGVEPAQIAPGDKAQVMVAVSDGFQKPVATASVKIVADTGYFEASNQNVAVGYTDKDGVFQAVWHSAAQTENGPQVFSITASKNGYIGKYPVTATAAVKVGEPSQ